MAMFPYSSTELGDLTFKQGDVITLVKAEGEWWTGMLDGKTGIFPRQLRQEDGELGRELLGKIPPTCRVAEML